VTDNTTSCIDCGAPATRHSSDGVPLCEGDYWHLVEHWRGEGFDREGGDLGTVRFSDVSERDHNP
jgi:hypothetical protein